MIDYPSMSFEEKVTFVHSHLPKAYRDETEQIAIHLVRGINKKELEELLGGDRREARELARMNLIGSLRGVGFDVSGGRNGGRDANAVYQVQGFVEKTSLPGKETWLHDDRMLLETIALSPVLSTDYSRLVERISTSITFSHEDCPLEIYSYELGSHSTKGFWWRDGIIIQRFENRPVFKYRPFDLPPEESLRVAEMLGTISCRPVQIVGISRAYANSLKQLHRIGGISRMEQAIYDPVKIATRTKEIWSKSDHDRFRRSARDTVIKRIEGGHHALGYLIDTWKETLGHRQRQLAIGRDYTAAWIDVPKLSFVGIRNELPVTCQIVDIIPGTTMACTIVEKSMNYSWQPNGRPGTSDWCLIEVCRYLVDHGITQLNYGSIAGGSQGLADHKRKLLSEITYSHSFITTFCRPK